MYVWMCLYVFVVLLQAAQKDAWKNWTPVESAWVEIMFMHYLAKELVTHKSARSSLMWYSQTSLCQDGEKDMYFCKCAPFPN